MGSGYRCIFYKIAGATNGRKQIMALHTTFATIDDLPQIAAIVRSNHTMYGVDISAQHDAIIGIFQTVLHDPEYAIICQHLNGRMAGVLLQRFWRELPFWSASNQFIDNAVWVGSLFTQTIPICRALSDFACNNAESKKFYDYVAIVRGDSQSKRDLTFSSTKFLTEYVHHIWQVVGPGEIPESALYRRLLGYTCGKTTKPVMIRHSSMKGEYRK